MQLKLGGKFHLKLNIGERPIANKYREGKMKSTLERELTVREIVERETLEVSLVVRNSTCFCKVYFPVNRPASVFGDGKGRRKVAIFGCVIAFGWIHRWGLRNAARLMARLSSSFALRMLA